MQVRVKRGNGTAETEKRKRNCGKGKRRKSGKKGKRRKSRKRGKRRKKAKHEKGGKTRKKSDFVISNFMIRTTNNS